MTITLENANPGASEEALQAFEREIGSPLPAQYRAFLAAQNGAGAESNEFNLADGSNSDGLQTFYSLDEIREDLDQATDDPDERFPEGIIPIADTETGNRVCLKLSDGTIWFLDHELEPQDSGALTRIARDFDRFFSAVEPFDQSAVQPKPGQVRSTHINRDWARANAHLYGDKFKAEHPEIFG